MMQVSDGVTDTLLLSNEIQLIGKGGLNHQARWGPQPFWKEGQGLVQRCPPLRHRCLISNSGQLNPFNLTGKESSKSLSYIRIPLQGLSIEHQTMNFNYIGQGAGSAGAHALAGAGEGEGSGSLLPSPCEATPSWLPGSRTKNGMVSGVVAITGDMKGTRASHCLHGVSGAFAWIRGVCDQYII